MGRRHNLNLKQVRHKKAKVCFLRTVRVFKRIGLETSYFHYQHDTETGIWYRVERGRRRRSYFINTANMKRYIELGTYTEE